MILHIQIDNIEPKELDDLAGALPYVIDEEYGFKVADYWVTNGEGE